VKNSSRVKGSTSTAWRGMTSRWRGNGDTAQNSRPKVKMVVGQGTPRNGTPAVCGLAGGGTGAPGRADRLVRFLLDMGISVHLIPELQADGHEAAHLIELSAGTLSDAEVLARARDENEVLLVHDLDFPLLVAASGSRSRTK
jgi:hypothetical protein